MISAVIEALIGSISLSTGLHTKKIDANILYLQQYEWFRMIYEDEKYRKLFITNYKVRSYLQSKLRVRLLVKIKMHNEDFKISRRANRKTAYKLKFCKIQ